ncbi:MAG: IS66 family insertion sequence element accessory protein TnpA [Candidatus Binatia bacterium]
MGSTGVAEVAGLPYWREDDARVIVDAWQRGGEPLPRFAERHGVDPRRLARWAARLKKERREPATLQFHAVRLASTGAPADGSIEIAFGDGRRVRVARGFETEDLRRVLAVLGERATC